MGAGTSSAKAGIRAFLFFMMRSFLPYIRAGVRSYVGLEILHHIFRVANTV